MPKTTLKRFMPTPRYIRSIRSLRFLGEWLYQPNLWHINRGSASRAFFVGLFLAFMPIPIQMFIAAFMAVRVRCNLPIAVGLCWISNPLTMPPMFYFAYRVGAVVLGTRPQPLEFQLTWEWLSTSLVAVWQPFLLGCLLCGFFFGSLGFFTIQLLWRWQAVQRWEARRLRRRLAIEKATRDVERRQAAIAQRDEPDTAPPGSTESPPPR
ncbi:MAG: DUF2062 domain-containing protein [Halieaceae bacterium]|jgi:uncharacterized protein (DUF2062 family)|nr:DUF2062 domain-containing protein [Halieaceae bacterium]